MSKRSANKQAPDTKSDFKEHLLLPLAVAIMAGLILLAFEYHSSLFVPRNRDSGLEQLTPVVTVNVPPSVSNKVQQTVDVSEGEVRQLLFDDEVVSIGIPSYGNLFGFVYMDVTVTIATPKENKHETLKLGDCIIVGSYSVNLIDVKAQRPQRATLLVTRLAPDADTNSCRVIPVQQQ